MSCRGKPCFALRFYKVLTSREKYDFFYLFIFEQEVSGDRIGKGPQARTRTRDARSARALCVGALGLTAPAGKYELMQMF